MTQRWLARMLMPMLLLLLMARGVPALSQLPDIPECPDFKALCIQAERNGGIDLKTGVAHLEGNVVGVIKTRGVAFFSQSLTAYRDGKQGWSRLVLEGDVRIERDTLTINGTQVVIETQPRRIVAQGTPLIADIKGDLIPGTPAPTPALANPASDDADSGTVSTEEAPQGNTWLRAGKAVLEEDGRRLTLSGDVHIEQSDQGLILSANTVNLFFDDDDQLDAFRAEGHVVMTQPDRIISADQAQSRNHLQTILLIGNARLSQPGQFDLASERMEVYTEANRGLVQSEDQQKPITLSLDLAGSKPYLLNEAGLARLGEGGLPPATLQKLAPLVGVSYPKRDAFSDAVRALLTQKESDQYLEKILAQARSG